MRTIVDDIAAIGAVIASSINVYIARLSYKTHKKVDQQEKEKRDNG